MNTRVRTAAIGIPLILGILLFGKLNVFFLFILTLALLCLSELKDIVAKGGIKLDSTSLYLYAVLILAAGAYAPLERGAFLLFFIVVILHLSTVLFKKDAGEKEFKTVLTFTLAQLFITLPLSLLLEVRKMEMQNDALYLLFFILFIWLGDTAAYYSGKSLGIKKLAPSVSPGKTVAGAIGQIIFSVLFMVYFAEDFGLKGNMLMLATWGILLSGTALISDLSESFLKRQFGVKDSGTIIPGHGGVLDRIDSFFLTSPLFFCYILALH